MFSISASSQYRLDSRVDNFFPAGLQSPVWIFCTVIVSKALWLRVQSSQGPNYPFCNPFLYLEQLTETIWKWSTTLRKILNKVTLLPNLVYSNSLSFKMHGTCEWACAIRGFVNLFLEEKPKPKPLLPQNCTSTYVKLPKNHSNMKPYLKML